MSALPSTVTDTLDLLGSADYIADRSLATAVHLALHLKRPLFLEGEAGVGKTEIAKVLATALGRRLIRLQCYEGLDVATAVYEWDYARQMIEIRLAEAADEDRDEIESTIFSDRFLIKRPLLQALEPEIEGPPVLLIDELDRTDEPFEAYLLELQDAKAQALAAVNRQLADLDAQLASERPRVDTNNPDSVSRYKALLERRDAAFGQISPAQADAARAVARYNASVDEYNQRCTRLPFDPGLAAAMQGHLNCPPLQ